MPFYVAIWKPTFKKGTTELDLDPEEIEQGYKTDDVKKFWTKFDKEGKVIGKNCVVQLLEWLRKDIHNGYYLVAHNSGKYDTHFIVNEIFEINILTRI